MRLASDFDALAFQPEREHDPYAKHFIKRAGARNKHLSVQFDPEKHKEWVTGYHKRRTERKTAARKSLEIRAKQERLDDRQQRFEQKKQDLNLPNDYGVGDIDADEGHDVEIMRGQKLYTDAGVRTVVTTSAIAMNSDDEIDSSDSEGEDLHHPVGVLAAPGLRQNGTVREDTSTERAPPRGNRSKGKQAGACEGGKNSKRTSCAERLQKMSQAKERKKSRQGAPRAKQKGGKGKGKRSR